MKIDFLKHFALLAILTTLVLSAPAYAISAPMDMSSQDDIATPTPTIKQQQQYNTDATFQSGLDPNFRPDGVVSPNSLKIKLHPVAYDTTQPVIDRSAVYPSTQLEQPNVKLKTYSNKDNQKLTPVELDGD